MTQPYGLATLVLAHVAAALKHHFVDRDGLVQRMLPVLPQTPKDQ